MVTTQRKVGQGRKFFVPVVFLLSLVLLAACGDSTANKTPTPTPTNSGYTTLNLGIPKEALDAPVTGTVPDSQILHVGVSFKLNQDVVNKLKKRDGTTKDATTVANQLGITDEQYQKIKEYFGIENATLNLGKLHTYLKIDAKSSTFAHLLQTKFVTHTLNGQSYYTPDATMPPKLPTVIAQQILTITGLDSYGAEPKTGVSHTSLANDLRTSFSQASHSKSKADTCAPNPRNLSINQIAHAYGYDKFWQAGYHGEDLTVNLVEIDGFIANDIATYFDCVGFSPDNFSVVNVNGQPTQVEGETELDIDMVAGLAPKSKIIDYQTGSRSFRAIADVLQQIVDDNASNTNSANVVSISLGAWEGYLDGNALTAVDSALQQLVQVDHMTVFVASGDCGAFVNGKYNSLSVSFPASDPWSTAIGGTVLKIDGGGNRVNEVAWSNGSNKAKCENQWGTGGGVSQVFQRPDWQQGSGVQNQYSTGGRELPDAAAVADNIAVYLGGKWRANGGTSAAAPIWAAGMLLVNEAMINNTSSHTFFFGPDTFYDAANKSNGTQSYYNVTRGNNLYYNATRGWNYPTGFGTPNLVNFYNVLKTLVS